MKFDIYEMITNRVIEQMKNGVIPWKKPWFVSGAWSRSTGKHYTLTNQWLLPQGEYATFNQLVKEGHKIPKGAKTYQVVFWKFLEKDTGEKDTAGEPIVERIPILRYYNVFNVAELGIKPKYDKAVNGIEKIEDIEAIKKGYIDRSGVLFHEMPSKEAYYNPRQDRVVVPLASQFNEVAEYYSTVFHELAHSTGHSTRLNRGLEKNAKFGSEDYSKEELVAEITASSILCASGIETDSSFKNNTAYIQNWLSALKNDKHLLVSASGKAEKAFNMIMGLE